MFEPGNCQADNQVYNEGCNQENAMTEIKPKIRDFLSRQFHNHTFADDEDFFASGFVNSLFAMQLVIFVEQEFGITVDDEDLDIANFRTINAIAALVERKAASIA